MGYGPGGLGRDGNRGIHAPTQMGDDHAAEGMVTVGSLTVPGNNLLGQPSMNGPTAGRQMLPDPDLHGDGVYDVSAKVNGPRELLGQGIDESIKDDDYPGIRDVVMPGDPPVAPLGQSGEQVDWASVAPYEYPEFGEQPSPKAGAGDSVLPYT